MDVVNQQGSEPSFAKFVYLILERTNESKGRSFCDRSSSPWGVEKQRDVDAGLFWHNRETMACEK
jgi:hypothetical protein